MPVWDPEQYLKYESERLRPALDLLQRVPLQAPGRVVDLGCGTGNTTGLLAERWPEAALTGVDASPEMLAEARAGGLPATWEEADIGAWTPAVEPDLIYSNAALHWLDDHAELFPRLAGLLAAGGVLAVQMPGNFDRPSHSAIRDTVVNGPWGDRLQGLLRPAPVAAPEDYYDLLAARAAWVDIWETTYLHVLEGEDPVVEWLRSTALKPFLDALDGVERRLFLADYAGRLRAAYPPRDDGRTLYPMRRVFIVAGV